MVVTSEALTWRYVTSRCIRVWSLARNVNITNEQSGESKEKVDKWCIISYGWSYTKIFTKIHIISQENARLSMHTLMKSHLVGVWHACLTFHAILFSPWCKHKQYLVKESELVCTSLYPNILTELCRHAYKKNITFCRLYFMKVVTTTN